MDAENSEKFLCSNCGEQELEDVGWGFKCRNCGYAIQRDNPPMVQIDTPIGLFTFTVVHLIPIILYFSFALILCGYTLWYTCHLFLNYNDLLNDPVIDPMIKVISTIVLFILLSLAIMDLNTLIIAQYVRRIGLEKDKKIWGILPVFCMDIPDASEAVKDDRRYIAKVIAISVVLILMHTFYIILTHPSGVYLSAGDCLLGAAAVLITVGVWKVLDSKSD
ncbi:MAG: hypothetical protein C4B59_16480 [Candidatus Methanogaster sp.]|uniref:Uncharacterized protein n=1 Tax=Candidatus Methanogaster sp. TaxID=3386292 RepID=A0AC61KY29_9EURY|nr:MAG: hypothetical protein C4B59_16480 [ANME-2 cluster archaeon]